MTARDLIKSALRLIGVLASGENPTAEEAQDALASLNSLIESWRNERLMVYAILPETFALQAGKLSYTLGPGGDFDTVRPVRVDKVQLTYTQSPGVPLNLNVEIIDLDQYQQFVVPETASSIPLWVYIDAGFPLRTLYFYTVPSVVNQVQLFTWQALPSLVTLDAELVLPPGYERALRYGLACELAPEYGAEPSETIAFNARSAKAALQSVNNSSPLMQVDGALVANDSGFNYLIGE